MPRKRKSVLARREGCKIARGAKIKNTDTSTNDNFHDVMRQDLQPSPPCAITSEEGEHPTPATALTASQIYFGKIPEQSILEAPTPANHRNPQGDTVFQQVQEMDVDEMQEEIVNLPIGRRLISCHSLLTAINKINEHVQTCGTMKLHFKKEEMNSLQSLLKFQCWCGFEILIGSDTEVESHRVNTAIAWGAASAAVGHRDLVPLLTSLDVPAPSLHTFKVNQDLVESDIIAASEKSMKAAAEEEKRLAVESGDMVTLHHLDGTNSLHPCIKVIVDGSWAKRSYGHSYTSNYGMAAIIGSRTGKVLHVGVRVKVCYVCTRYNRKVPHNCFKNWTGASTAMEADIIVDGFKKSIEEHGLVYNRFIGDGDSSVFAKVINLYPGISVEKIECLNHVVRNLNTKLTAISKNSIPGKHAPQISQEERRIKNMDDRFKRIGRDLMGAVQHYHAIGNFESDWTHLRDDILNIPYHVFGRHSNCKAYFSCSKAGKEPDLVDNLKDKPIFKCVVDAVSRPAKLAKSLIRRENSNVVESFMGVIAKFINGKRKNLGGRSLYHMKVASAVISFNNTGFCAADAFKLQFGKSPAALWKKAQRRLTTIRKSALSRSKKPRPRNLNYHFLKTRVGDDDYGSDPAKPPLEGEELNLAIQNFKESLNVDSVKQLEIETETKSQSDCPAWFQQRRSRITASNAKKIARLMDSTDNRSTILSLLYSDVRGTAVDYGKSHENEAIRAYEQFMEIESGSVRPSGIFVSLSNGIFAATPDGLVNEDGIVEVKCPYSLRNMKPEDWPHFNKARSAMKIDESGQLHLKTDHDYFYQVAAQLHVTQRDWCDFVVWTPNGIFVQRIFRDSSTEDLWKSIAPKLEKFWNEDLAPEIVDPQFPRQLRIPNYRASAIAKKCQQKSPSSSTPKNSSTAADNVK